MEYRKIWKPDECFAWGSGNLEVKGEFVTKPLPPVANTKYLQSPVIDPDYDNIENILGRLEENVDYRQELSINSSCDCSIANHLRLQKPVNVDGSDCSDNEDEEVQLSDALKMLNRIRNNPLKKASSKAFVTLINTLNYRSKVTQDEITEIFGYFDKEVVEIQELALCVVSQLCVGKDNVHVFLHNDILSTLQSKLSPMRPPQPLSAVVKVLDKIISHDDLKEKWLDPVQDIFVPLLLRHLQVEELMEFKLTVCCFFKRLAQFQEFAQVTLTEVVPVIHTVKSESPRIKEVYTEVIMGAVKNTHQIPPHLIEMEVLPTAASLIKEGPCGPQKQALSLLVLLSQTEAGVSTTATDPEAIPLVFRCIRQSKCKKVRAEAINVLHRVTSTRRLGLSKDLMAHMADYLIPPPQISSSIGYCVVEIPPAPLIKSKYEREGMLWKGLDQLGILMKDIMCKEAKIQLDEHSIVKNIDFSPSMDACPTCVGTLCHSVTILLNICIWPVSKSRHDVSRIDLANFTDSQTQRVKLSKINRVLTQTVWDNAGTSVTAILSQFSKKIKRVLHIAEMIRGKNGDSLNSQLSFQSEASQRFQAAVNRNGTVDLLKVFTELEVQLIETILEFLLCVSLCTCKGFIDMMPKEDNSCLSITVAQKNRQTKSDSDMDKSASVRKPPRPASASSYRPRSPTKCRESFQVPLNPPNTPRLSVSQEKVLPTQDPLEKHHMDLLSREAATDRRLLRKCLYEAGVFFCVGPFINCSQPHCQTLACQILRCNIQPLEEKVMPAIRTKAPRMRPQSAVHGKEAEKKLNIAIHRMSPELAGMIKDALGPRPSSALSTPKHITRPQSAHPVMDTAQSQIQTAQPIHINMTREEDIEDTQAAARLTEFIQNSKKISEKEKSLDFDLSKLNPHIDSTLPIAGQCRLQLLEGCGNRLLAVLFSSPKENRKYCLQLIQDLVHYGEVNVHMKLSEFGCMQKLLDFLRVNMDNELLEILGLVIVQMLCKSDIRLRQMFDRHGGTRLLMMLTRNTDGLLRQEVTKTLKAVTRDLPKKKLRPKSAPAIKEEEEPDVWDKIMERWKTEDQVCKVLRQWIKK